MAEQHPITPSDEQVKQCLEEIWHEGTPVQVAASDLHVATQFAQWGADQELEACCEWASQFNYDDYRYQDELRSLRRPKPPSLAEEALETLRSMRIKPVILDGINVNKKVMDKYDTIRRALERLQELEEQADG